MLQSWFNENIKKQVLIKNIIDEKNFLDEVRNSYLNFFDLEKKDS